MDHVGVIVPINSDVDEAEQVAEDRGQDGTQTKPGRFVRHMEFQNHDCDDDGEHTITERLQTVLVHRPPSIKPTSKLRLFSQGPEIWLRRRGGYLSGPWGMEPG